MISCHRVTANYIISSIQTMFGEQAFCYTSMNTWNHLAEHIQYQTSSYGCFMSDFPRHPRLWFKQCLTVLRVISTCMYVCILIY